MSAVGLQGAALVGLLVLVTWAVLQHLRRSGASAGLRLPGALGRGRQTRGLSAVPTPTARPLEEIAYDARRLAARVHEPPRGTSFAKHLAACCVYDRVLGEACAALGVEHLLGVLPPGEDLDAERRRIESALWLAGLRLEDAA